MNARGSQDFAIVQAPEAQWLVLRCAPAQTLRIASLLSHLGAWVPTWKRMRRVARANVRRLTTEACMPSFVFIPAATASLIPQNVDCRPMRFDGAPVFVRDRQLEALRAIADKPLPSARQLPKPGEVYRLTKLGFEGLAAKVIRCTQRACMVEVAGFSQPIQVPPLLLMKN